jgi:hypothetical protein
LALPTPDVLLNLSQLLPLVVGGVAATLALLASIAQLSKAEQQGDEVGRAPATGLYADLGSVARF